MIIWTSFVHVNGCFTGKNFKRKLVQRKLYFNGNFHWSTTWSHNVLTKQNNQVKTVLNFFTKEVDLTASFLVKKYAQGYKSLFREMQLRAIGEGRFFQIKTWKICRLFRSTILIFRALRNYYKDPILSKICLAAGN